jgi:hypothetical protein
LQGYYKVVGCWSINLVQFGDMESLESSLEPKYSIQTALIEIFLELISLKIYWVKVPYVSLVFKSLCFPRSKEIKKLWLKVVGMICFLKP